jgi:hypothetical protein
MNLHTYWLSLAGSPSVQLGGAPKEATVVEPWAFVPFVQPAGKEIRRRAVGTSTAGRSAG